MLRRAWLNDHRAVVEIGKGLVGFAAFFDEFHGEALAGNDDGAKGLDQFMEIEHGDVLQLGDTLQIVVVGHDLGVEHLGQSHEFGVDFLDLRQIVVVDFDFDMGVGLQISQHVETATAPGAFYFVADSRRPSHASLTGNRSHA